MNNGYTYSNYQVYEPQASSPRIVLMRHLKHWKWYALSLTLALAGAFFYLRYQAPVYRVHASLLIKDEKKGSIQEMALKELDAFTSKKVVENEIEILQSNTLMEEVVDKLHLDVQYYSPTRWGDREIYAEAPVRVVVDEATPALYKTPLQLTFPDARTVRIDDRNYPLNQPIATPYGRLRVYSRKTLTDFATPLMVRVMSRRQAIASVLGRLKVEATSKTSTVLDLTLDDAVPAKGEAILNELILAYNKAAVDDKNRIAAATLKFLDSRLRLISGELMTAERNVEAYKATEGITDLGTQSQNFLVATQQNDAQLNQLNIQLGVLGEVEQFLNNKGNQRGAAPATLGLNDPVLLGLINKVTEMEMERDELTRTTSSRNPMLQSLESNIKATKANISENIQSMKQMLVGTRDRLQATNQRMEALIRTVPRKERALLDITRQQTLKNNLYTYLQEKREETALSYASTVSDSRLVDRAHSDDKPVKPVRRVFFLLFGLAGLLLPMGVIAAKDLMNDRVSGRLEVEGATSAPILGEVIQGKKQKGLVIHTQGRSLLSEQIRAIRTNLQYLNAENGGSSVVLFTSSISGEGKSFISLNLGASLSLLNHPTVILEMDLREPKLHKSLGISNAVGLSDYLAGEARLEDILQPVPGYPQYQIIPSGPVPSNPAELLAGSRMAELFAQLRQTFSFVLIDTPPIGLVTDARLIAPFADSTMYIVRHDKTPKTHLRMIENLYREQRFKQLSIILNAVDGTQSSYYYTSPTASLRRLNLRNG